MEWIEGEEGGREGENAERTQNQGAHRRKEGL